LPYNTDYQAYLLASGNKAFAVAKENNVLGKYTWAWSVGHPDTEIAKRSALVSCKASVRNLNRSGICNVFAVNQNKAP
jgi:hypothetical protein